MRTGTRVAALVAAWPGLAWACPTCISAAYGDRTFNWAYLGLLLAPLGVAVIIGGVLAAAHFRSKERT
ncbi:MAG TPA: hypothetical protein VNO23_15850 [Candidatus Binatia bacterium]|nr:hypothetical protein [Bacillota bacterium]HXG04873.1 hypothetical protein [Candidatus Binatia bacterium]